MKILLKCPTRQRRARFVDTIYKWVEFADHPESLGILVTADSDDVSMGGFSEKDLPDSVAWKKVCFGNSKTKIEACNADMKEVDWEWDIVILVSDDMIPIVRGYDTRIRSGMHKSLDHVVWVYDGLQNGILNTLNIFGRVRYETWGYMYYPEYKSFFCDNEVTDWCKSHPMQCTVIPTVLIKHDHPLATGKGPDALYIKNQVSYSEDKRLYDRRRMYTSTSRLGFLKLLSRR